MSTTMRKLTAMDRLTWEEFQAKFPDEVVDALRKARMTPGTAALVLSENQQMDSSSFGARTAMRVGPACTYKTWQECEGHWLHDLPSQRQYIVAYTEDMPPDKKI